jgi:streptogramin lyase
MRPVSPRRPRRRRGAGIATAAIGCLAAVAASFALCVSSAGAAPLGKIEEFPRPAGSFAEDIVAGPDGNLWFTQTGSDKGIVKLSPTGQVLDEFSAGLGASNQPVEIVAGHEGNLWFTDPGTVSGIGRITPSGEITEFKTGFGAGTPSGIAAGAEGDIWFTEIGKTVGIGRITPSGEITLYTVGFNPGSRPSAIVAGPEGNLWFTDPGATTNAIGRITPSGTVNEFSIPHPYLTPNGIAAGPDGNLWFTATGENEGEEFEYKILRITPGGNFTAEYTPPESLPLGIAAGPDGNLWFAGVGSEPDKPAVIGQITPGGAIAEFHAGLKSGSEPTEIAPGPDGNMWFVDKGTTKAVGLAGVGVPSASQSPPVISGAAQVGSQLLCQGASWSSWASLQPSTSMFGFDGYQWLLDGHPFGQSGQSYTPTAAEVGHQLACSVTATYPLLNVTVTASSAGVTVSPAPVVSPPPAPPPPPTPPRVEATMTWTFGWTRHYTLVESLTVHGVPKGGYVEVACKGKGCPFTHHRSATVASVKHSHPDHCHHGHKCSTRKPPPQGPTVNLAGLFKGHHLHVGASISVSVLKKGWIGRSFVFTTRSGRSPSVSIACLAPGSTHPGKGC